MLNIRYFPRVFALILLFSTFSARADVQALLQMADYMGVDYPGAVENGQVVNEFEYAEMVEFAERISVEIENLETSPVLGDLKGIAAELADAVNNKAPGFMIAEQTQAIRRLLMNGYNIELTPRAAPDLTHAAQIFMDQCSSCHGEKGHGDGFASANMDPAPTDFHDLERASQRSVFGLFNTITLGVGGTAMPAFPSLDDEERWALAFYVGGLIDDPEVMTKGEQAWNKEPLDLTEAVTLSPAELSRTREHGEALNFWIRKFPENLFSGKDSPLNVSRELLAASLQSYFDGDIRSAQEQAITAYLEGFELVEAPLSNVNDALMRRAEAAMISYRQAIAAGIAAEDLQVMYDNVISLLNQSNVALSGEALSPSVAFSGSLIILLREGLEIILVLAAIFTFLVKSNRQDALKYVHAGWVVALIAGVATWAVSNYLFTISGATREITEGVTALIAAAILMYVGFWMHRNANAKRWASYIRNQLEQALDAKTLWTLAIVSFLAVYREIFEIILFYQALWAQVEASAQASVFYGAGVAIMMLVLTTWLIYKFGMKLPLSTFFNVSAVLLVLLAFIFAGKGIAAMQEAGSIASTPLPGPTIDILGIYPNAQALGLQAVVLVLTFIVLFWEKFQKKGTA